MRRLPWVLASACALVLAACGGSSGDEAATRYVDAVNRAQQAFAQRVDRLSAGITRTSSPARDRRTLRSFQAAVDQVGGDLRRIDPPKAVRGEHQKLVRAVDGFGAEVQDATEALDSDSPAKLRSAQQELQQASTTFGTTLNATIDAINRELGS